MWSAEAWTINKAKSGDHRAFAKLYDRHAPIVYRLLHRLTGNAATAEDMTQDTFLAAYQSLSAWRGEGKFSTYLCGIAFKLYAASRRRVLQTEELDDSIPSANPLDDPQATFTHREAEKALESAIASLPDPWREAYILIRVEGISYKETSRILEVPLGTIQSRLWRASRFLQTALSPLLYDTEQCPIPQSQQEQGA